MLFIFGQSEKGVLCRPTLCYQLPELFQFFGHAPEMSQGLYLAIQSLLFQKPCIFFRVEEEGYSVKDYLKGLDILKSDWQSIHIEAIGMPGVANGDILEKTERLFHKRRSLILLTEKDLFDYLTS